MVNWLVIGIGDVTRKRVIPAILEQPHSNFAAVLTRDPAKADAFPGTRVFTSLHTALGDDSIDAVYVASPVALHAGHTIAALRAGRHVLCEKPVAMDYAQAVSMSDAAQASGRLLGVAYFRRLFPKLIRAKELIAQGAIGQPVFAEAKNHGWLESEERGWLRDAALAGGGPLYDIGSHRIDTFNYLFGKPVSATGMRANAFHRMTVEDSATVLIAYPNGVHATVDVRWNSRVPRDEFRVIGTEGELDLNPLHGPELRLNDSVENIPRHPNVHYPIVEDFVNAVLDGTPPACPIDQAIQTDWVTEQVVHGR